MTNPRPSSPETGKRLARVKQANTSPDIALRRNLHARGLRYRVQVPLLKKPRCKANIVFLGKTVAIFVDGCFWTRLSRTRYLAQIEFCVLERNILTNRARDQDTNRKLEEAGWTVLRVWEHEDPVKAAD